MAFPQTSRFWSLHPTRVAVAVMAIAAGVLPPSLVSAQAIDTSLWIPNGFVSATVRSGGTIYIGGSFSRLGPAIGAAVPIDDVTGQALGYPHVTGTVLAVAPDGAGGWYVGGQFSHVAGVLRRNLAHILADHSVAAWNPAPDSTVNAIVFTGGRVYVGGLFNNIGGQARSRIAALDGSSAGLATGWNPNANGNVNALALGGATLYAGGLFTNIGGQTRNRIAALDTTSGTATTWNPNSNGVVIALAVSGGTIYAGGSFSNIGGQARNSIAALSAATGSASGWNPNAAGTVRALAVGAGVVYAGGNFLTIGGQSRSQIAALDAASGLATAWNPNSSSIVHSLAVSPAGVHAGGEFTSIGGQTRNFLARLDASTGNATSWDPNPNSTVFALAIGAARVYAGGNFQFIGGVTRNNLAALDAATGQPTAWHPNISGAVNGLAISGSRVIAGGTFTTVGGLTRNRIASIDMATGAPSGPSPSANNTVNAVLEHNGMIYLGGAFTTINTVTTRNRLAAFNPGTGALASWNPNANADVYALAAGDTVIYVGGDFTTLTGGFNRIAAVGMTNGLPDVDWNPNADQGVRALAVSGGTVYVGGFFGMIGGNPRSRIAALSASSGLATPWNPSANNTVFALAAGSATVYAGGTFDVVNGQSRIGIAAVSAAGPGIATSWNPTVPGSVTALRLSGANLDVGGSFNRIGGWPQARFASIAAFPGLAAIVPATGGNQGTVTATITGSGLPPGATVKLTRAAHTDIPTTGVVVASDGLSITATFHLLGANPGAWNVVVTTPGGQTASLPNGFLITQDSSPALRVAIVGLSQFMGAPAVRRDRRTALDLVIENDGNVDALAVPLWVTGIPTDAQLELDFALGYPAQAGGEPDWTTVPMTFTSGAGTYLTLVIPRVRPGTTTRRIYLTVPGPTHPPFTLTAAVAPPWVDGAVFRSCLATAGITNPACMGSQMTAMRTALTTPPTAAAVSAIAMWAKVAWQCEGTGTLPTALTKAEQVLDYLGAAVETGTTGPECSDVALAWWRDVENVSVVGAVDPNDKLGATGTVAGQQSVPYSIRFENVGSIAAQDVVIDDVLDATKLDLNTLSLQSIRFGNVHIEPPPGQRNYSTTVTLPAQNLRVDVSASLDLFTSHLTWYFRSFDLTTGASPALGAGFLPVNDATHAGEGSVMFTVRPKSGTSGSVTNAASILFDDPPATNTPAWVINVDNVAPASHVQPLAGTQGVITFPVQWQADASPDVRDYTVYASENNGPYWAWRVNTTALSDTFQSRNGFSYRFYSRARDVSGNLEPTPGTHDAQTQAFVVGVEGTRAWTLSLAGSRPNPATGPLSVWLTLPNNDPAWLEAYDVTGRRVARQAVGALGAGEHMVRLGGATDLRAGLYFLRLTQGGRMVYARCALVR